ncbi:MAG: PQQ-binding-like beta-propeller repeat protein, partial [Pirellulaceae bacterium]|nr:PQQ-binding-like beta-propeller repeat protein [Pirellulaceae bacterium]
VCVNAHTGQEIWRQRWLTTFGCNAADPIVVDDQVFLSSGYNRGSALLDIQGSEPTVRWKNKEMQNQISTSVLINGMLFGIHGDVDAGTQLRCVDWKTGDVNWSDSSFHPGGLTAAGDRLIVLTQSGELVVGNAAADSFVIAASHSVLEGKCWTSPVLSGGRIFCRSADGELVAVDVR